jgi:hypothetical protein
LVQDSLIDAIWSFWLQAADLLAIEGHVKDVCRVLAARIFTDEQSQQANSAHVAAEVLFHAPETISGF